MTLLSFARGATEAAGAAALISSALLAAGPRLLRWFSGAGLIANDRDEGPSRPLVIADPSAWAAAGAQAEPGVVALRDYFDDPRVADLIAAVAGRDMGARDRFADWSREAALWFLPELQPFASPGEPVVQALRGRLGFAAAWGGQRGFLTAGHVARTGAGPLRADQPPNNPVLGNVVVSADPAGLGAAPMADVALVAATGAAVPGPSGLPTAPVAAGALDQVRIGGSGATDRIRAFAQFYHSAAVNGTWGECYLTTNGVSQPGDSGAPVRNTRDEPVGTLVAGTPGHADLVQDLGYQLAGTGTAGLQLI